LIVEALNISATQNLEGLVVEYLEQELTAQTLSLKRLKQQFNQDYSQNFSTRLYSAATRQIP
jgi:hypothetical protein